MARQRGPLKIEGTLDDISFIKTADGYLAKMKSGISSSRFKTDPAFELVRQNGAEFNSAAKAGKLLRTAFATAVKGSSDTKVVSRLVKELMKVVKSDSTSARGLRTVDKGNLGFLQGFNFNVHAALKTTVQTPFTPNIDRPSGNLIVHIPAFVPGNLIQSPAGSTHFRFVVMGGEIDFGNNVYTTDIGYTAMLPIDFNTTANLDINATVPANSTQDLFLLFGIQFYQRVNGLDYAMNNGAFNAIEILSVSQA
jgi:hypothetical protein